MGRPIETYLADHLAGADAALDLVHALSEEHSGALAQFFQDLHTEIAEDRTQLEELMQRLGVERSRLRSAGARLAEKFGRLKLTGDDQRGGAFRLLEALDTLQSGIEGKRALWRALAAAAETDPRLALVDYRLLAERAESQRDRVDTVRLDAARAALAG
ncbi:MAG: hypothetical protein M3Y31_03800 [Gemmatimonadota bacterium]|nr:hypothetical protein [Gemmatimonadota bacterium]